MYRMRSFSATVPQSEPLKLRHSFCASSKHSNARICHEGVLSAHPSRNSILISFIGLIKENVSESWLELRERETDG